MIDLNVIGLRRSGVSSPVRADIKQAYKLLYRSQMNMSQAVEAIENEVDASLERDYLLDFIRSIRVGSMGRGMDESRH